MSRKARWGITQHIARDVEILSASPSTRPAQPFTQMRACGAQATDVVVLVVAADDGIAPDHRSD